MSSAIHVRHLCKSFTTRSSPPGLFGALKGLFSPSKTIVPAIQDLSFSIQPGERVAFIGPNGAGKSTTIKMLTGILYPSSGQIEVLGLVPWKQRKALGYQIGTVFGQRSQLWYHLPSADTFDLLARIYELGKGTYQKQLKALIEVFEIAPFLHKPVRQLSLGERMRCEMVASLLHQPKILFLDEPTIGLDVNAKLNMRHLLNRLGKEQGTTLFLTSHDTADIEQVCKRVLILDKGTLVRDSSLKELKKNYVKKKVITLVTEAETLKLDLPGVKIVEQTAHQTLCEVDLNLVSLDQVIHQVLQQTNLKDMTVEDPSMEEIIRTLYQR